jgi:hypothetical protein
MTDTALCRATATDLAARIRYREVSALEVMDAHLARVEEVNPSINAIVTLDADGARRAAILWKFLDAHEQCVAAAAGVDSFDLVTTVPSSTPEKDEQRSNFRTIVGWCEPISERYERVIELPPPG